MAEFKGLTIKLDLDSSGVQRGISEINKSLRASSTLLSAANKQLKLDPTNLDAVRQKFNALNQVIPQNQEKLKNLQAELRQLGKIDAGTGKFANEINRVNAEILKTSGQLKSYNSQLANLKTDYNIKFNTNGQIASLDANKFSNSLKEVGNSSNQLGAISPQAFAAAKAVVALKIAFEGLQVVLSNAAGSYANFQKEFSAAKTLLPQNTSVINAFADGVKRVSLETGVAESELSQGLYQALSAGVKVTEDAAVATEFLATSTKLAKGGFTTAETAVDTLTTILNAYKLETQEATKVSDQLIATQNLGKTTVAQLGSTLGNVIPVAADAGVAFDQVGASIATLTAQGIKTEVATTALRNILVELNDSSSKLGASFEKASGKGFKQFIEEGGNVQQAIKLVKDEAEKTKTPIGSIVGKETIAAFNTLASSTENFDKNLAGVRNSAGLTESNFKTATNNMIDQFAKLQNNLSVQGGQLFKPLIEGLTDFLQVVNNNAAIQALVATIIGLGVAFAGAVAAVASWSAIGGAVTTVATSIGAALGAISLPIVAIGAAIAALGVLVFNNFDLIKNEASKIGVAFSSLWAQIQPGLQPLIDFFTVTFNESIANVLPFLQQTWTQINQIFQSAVQVISALITNVLLPVIKTIADVFTTYVMPVLMPILEGLKVIFSNAFDGIKTIFSSYLSIIQNVFDAFKNLFTGNWSGLWENVKNIFSTITNTVASLFGNFIGTLGRYALEIVPRILGAVSNLGGSLWNAFSGALNSAINAFNNVNWGQVGRDIINGIISGVQSAGSALASTMQNMAGNALNAAKNALGIKSPSRVFRDVVGKQIPAGIAVGVEANTREAVNSITSLSNDLVNAANFDNSGISVAANSSVFSKSVPNGASTSTTNNSNQNINITLGNITLGGKATERDVSDLVKMISEQLGRELKGVY